jgi:hypothetical protein
VESWRPVFGIGFLAAGRSESCRCSAGGVIGSNEKAVSMNGLGSDRHYIVYLSWQQNGSGANIFDVFIEDSATSARLNGAEYDIALYKAGELVTSSLRTDQTTTLQFYNFEDQGEYVIFSIEVTPEFPLHMFAALAAAFVGMVALGRLRPIS